MGEEPSGLSFGKLTKVAMPAVWEEQQRQLETE
jgi:hypothetical protein